MKHLIVDKREIKINDDGSIIPLAYKGKMVNVVKINDLVNRVNNLMYAKETIIEIHRCFWITELDRVIDYCGG